jgi:membrane protease YdiL (CAAX protease family)
LELESNFAKLIFVQNEELKNLDYNAPLANELEKIVPAEPTPDNPPWNGLAAIGVWIMSVVFIIIFPNIFVLPYLARQNLDFTNRVALTEFVTTDKTAVILQLLAIIPAHILTIVLAWFVVTKFRKYSFRKMLGWEMGGFRIYHIFLIIVFFFALAGLLTSYFGETENDFLKILQSSRAAVFLVAFFATFTAPLVEEVVYRGVLYSAFQRKIGVIWSVVAVTFLFALVHVPQYSKDFVPDFVTVSVILLLSLVLTTIRVKTGNLLPCIVLHTVFNGIQSVLMILQPYLQHYLDANQQQTSAIFQLFK